MTRKKAMLSAGIALAVVGIVGVAQDWYTTGSIVFILAGAGFILASMIGKKTKKKK